MSPYQFKKTKPRKIKIKINSFLTLYCYFTERRIRHLSFAVPFDDDLYGLATFPLLKPCQSIRELFLSQQWLDNLQRVNQYFSRGALMRLLLAGVSSACPCRRNQWWWRLPVRTRPQGASWTPNRDSSGTLQQTFQLNSGTWLPEDTAGLADGCGSLKAFPL